MDITGFDALGQRQLAKSATRNGAAEPVPCASPDLTCSSSLFSYLRKAYSLARSPHTASPALYINVTFKLTLMSVYHQFIYLLYKREWDRRDLEIVR